MTNLTGTRKAPLGHNKRSSVHDDIPIRLAVTFAPSRARVLQGEWISTFCNKHHANTIGLMFYRCVKLGRHPICCLAWGFYRVKFTPRSKKVDKKQDLDVGLNFVDTVA